MTPAQVDAVAGEIAGQGGRRVRAVHQDGRHRFRLALEGRNGRADVVLDVDPAFPRCHLAPPAPAPGPPSPLAATLRRHLVGTRLVAAEAVPGERALRIALRRGDETLSLWFEGFGRGANLYLVDGRGIVVATPRGGIAARRAAGVGARFSPVGPDAGRALSAGPPLSEASQAVAGAAAAEAARTERDRRRRELLTRARGAVARARRRVEALEAGLAAADDARRWQERGQRLQAVFHRLAAGRERVLAPDLFGPDPSRELEVELDPTLEPAAQLERCFGEARRARRRAEEARARLPEARAVLARREAVLDALGTAGDGDDPAAMEAALGPSPGTAALPDAPARPWRTFTSADGWAVLVGRGAKANDELTRRRARPQDLFLHVRGAGGSHVLVPTSPGRTVPKETLLDAAELAVFYSARRGADWAEVDHTPWRYVRRPRGAAPGTVLLHRAKTLRIRPDPARRERLLGGRMTPP